MKRFDFLSSISAAGFVLGNTQLVRATDSQIKLEKFALHAWPVRDPRGPSTAVVLAINHANSVGCDIQLRSAENFILRGVRVRETSGALLGDAEGAIAENGAALVFFRPPSIAKKGVGRVESTLAIEVQTATGSSTYAPIATVRQTTYTILDISSAPWTKDKPQLFPLRQALDLVVAWANGATDMDSALERITQQLHRAGRAVGLRYEPNGEGSYTHSSGLNLSQNTIGTGVFMFDRFLERLLGGPGLGPQVNCIDIAQALWAFCTLAGANVLPVYLNEAVRDTLFSTRPVGVIGAGVGQLASYSFSDHMVVMEGTEITTPDISKRVWDACLSIDEAETPTMPVGLPYRSAYLSKIFSQPERIALACDYSPSPIQPPRIIGPQSS